MFHASSLSPLALTTCRGGSRTRRPAGRGRKPGSHRTGSRLGFSRNAGRSRAPLAHPDRPRFGSPRVLPDPACLQTSLREPGSEEAFQGRSSTYGSTWIGSSSPLLCRQARAFGEVSPASCPSMPGCSDHCGQQLPPAHANVNLPSRIASVPGELLRHASQIRLL